MHGDCTSCLRRRHPPVPRVLAALVGETQYWAGTEIVGAGVTSFSDTLSAEQTITEIDINFDDTAGNYHVFTPNVTAAIEYKHLYACATTTVSTDATAGRFTVELEYSVL